MGDEASWAAEAAGPDLLRLTAVVGDRLDSNWRHPMFEIIRYDVGRNEALQPWRIAEWQIPAPFNLFQNALIHPDRTFGNEIPTGKAGDRMVLRTLMDSIVSVSACPQDLNPGNGFHPSPLIFGILEPSQDPSRGESGWPASWRSPSATTPTGSRRAGSSTCRVCCRS